MSRWINRGRKERKNTHMNKSELIKSIATKAELSQKDAGKALDAFISSITEALKADEAVQLTGFGIFSLKTRAERKGKNPATGETITIPASTMPAFKPGKGLKDAVK